MYLFLGVGLFTISIDYVAMNNLYKYAVSIDASTNSTIETNDIFLDVFSQGIFGRNSKVLVSTSNAISDNSLIFAASRSGNLLKSFKWREKNSVLSAVSNFELMHTQSLRKEFNGVEKSNFFIFDLLTQEDRLLASIVKTYQGNKKCDEVMIVAIKFDHKTGRLLEEQKVWQYEGCLKWRDDAEPSGNLSLRLAASTDSIFMATGLEPLLPFTNVYPNDALIGLPSSLALALNEHPIFGSILRIPMLKDDINEYSVIAKGLRSPQGLLYISKVDSSAELWISDHGPRGGDELNILKLENKIVDFGWPKVSLGTYYMNGPESVSGSLPVKFGDHSGFQAPIFYWTPSIAPSQISQIPESFTEVSKQWGKQYLLLATLKDSSIHKLRIRNDRHVISDERVFLGERLRDMSSNSEVIVLGTDSGKIIIVSPKVMKSHSGSFPPTPIYREPQKPSFMNYFKIRFQQVINRSESVLGR
jgi:hypothetical protein